MGSVRGLEPPLPSLGAGKHATATIAQHLSRCRDWTGDLVQLLFGCRFNGRLSGAPGIGDGRCHHSRRQDHGALLQSTWSRPRTFLQSHLGVTHFGLVYARDLYGTSMGEAIQNAARQHNPTVQAIAYEMDDDHRSLRDALLYLKSTDLRYFDGVFPVESYKAAYRIAHETGIMGHPGYQWIMGSNAVHQLQPDFSLNATEQDIAHAMNGIINILPSFPENKVLTSILLQDMPNDNSLWQGFVEGHSQDDIRSLYLQDFNFTATPLVPSQFVGQIYDAAITVGSTACQQSNPFFSGQSLLATMRQNTSLQGASRFVTLKTQRGQGIYRDCNSWPPIWCWHKKRQHLAE